MVLYAGWKEVERQPGGAVARAVTEAWQGLDEQGGGNKGQPQRPWSSWYIPPGGGQAPCFCSAGS